MQQIQYITMNQSKIRLKDSTIDITGFIHIKKSFCQETHKSLQRDAYVGLYKDYYTIWEYLRG